MTPSEPPRRAKTTSHSPIRFLAAAGLALAVAGSLLTLGGPRLLANAQVVIGAAPARQAFYAERPIPPEALVAAEAAYRRAFALVDDPAWRIELGRMQLQAAQNRIGEAGGPTAAARSTLEGAAANLEAALGLRPSDSVAWAELAYARLLLGDAAGFWAATAVSLEAGPAKIDALFARLERALPLWSVADAATRAQLIGQMERVAELAPLWLWQALSYYNLADEVTPLLSEGARERLAAVAPSAETPPAEAS